MARPRVVADLGPASGGYAPGRGAGMALRAVPDGLGADTAVALIGTGRTAMAVLEHAAIAPDDVVVVTAAAGGLGSLFVQAAATRGATVVGLAGGAEKVDAGRGARRRRRRGLQVAGLDAEVRRALAAEPTLVLDGVGGGSAGVRSNCSGRAGASCCSAGPRARSRRSRPPTSPHVGCRVLVDRPGDDEAVGEPRATGAEGPRHAAAGLCRRRRALRVGRRGGAHRALEGRKTIGKGGRCSCQVASADGPDADVAPAFVEMAHRIVWCTVATTDADGRPRTRVLHPIWEWDGSALTGWIATSPLSPKARRPGRRPGRVADLLGADARHVHGRVRRRVRGRPGRAPGRWDRFANGPGAGRLRPVDHPGVDGPAGRGFGVLRLTPRRLRVCRAR